MEFELIEVGGKVRDEILGIESNDIDYTVVINNVHKDPYDEFVKEITKRGYDIFESKPSCYTVRSRFPTGHIHEGLTADFVIARKEIGYNANSRVPITEYGDLYDDLIRRDFTVNAVGRKIDGSYIDPFGGISDLIRGLLRTPTNTALSFTQDPLRVVRAIRFAVTRDLHYSDDILSTLRVFDSKRMGIVSVERIRNELRKMFKYDTEKSLEHLTLLRELNYSLYKTLFKKGLWFEPTLKK